MIVPQALDSDVTLILLKPAKKKRLVCTESALAGAEHVRTFVQDQVPEDYSPEEKAMFGMAMWMVRGNMFAGFGIRNERLLVRVGEDAVESILAQKPVGVTRCGGGGRTFKGTLMIEAEPFGSEKQLRRWANWRLTG